MHGEMMSAATALEQGTARTLPPHILVVIPTRNRPADLDRCLESLLQVAYPSWELLIVDQSDGDATRQVAEGYRQRLPEITYHRMQERGACRARNVALEWASSEIVAYLDDDCTVGHEWLTGVAAAFLRHPAAALVFGSVYAASHDSSQELVPEVIFDRERTVGGPFTHAEIGMGASMYLWPARSAYPQPFDVHLGAGTRWPSAEEGDLACRLIRGGAPVVLTPAIRVCHHGARPLCGGVAGKLFRGYALGFGAMDMKMIRCGDWRSLWRALDQIRRYLGDILLALVTRGRPSGLGSLAMYVRGLAESFLLPVDRRRCLYVAAAAKGRVAPP